MVVDVEGVRVVRRAIAIRVVGREVAAVLGRVGRDIIRADPQELAHPLVALEAAAAPPPRHARADEREILHRVDERVVLDQLALLPQQAVELAYVVRPEPREEHELLRRRHGRDRVHLQEPELAHGVEHTGRAAVEKLCAYGDAPGAFERELYAGIRTDTTRSSARAR